MVDAMAKDILQRLEEGFKVEATATEMLQRTKDEEAIRELTDVMRISRFDDRMDRTSSLCRQCLLQYPSNTR